MLLSHRLWHSIGIVKTHWKKQKPSSIRRQYSEAKEYDAAVRCYLCALTAMKQLDEPKYKALCYSHLGNANFRQGLYAKGLRYYKDAVRTFEIKDSTNYAISLLDADIVFYCWQNLIVRNTIPCKDYEWLSWLIQRRRSRLLSVIWALSIRSGKNIKSLGTIIIGKR